MVSVIMNFSVCFLPDNMHLVWVMDQLNEIRLFSNQLPTKFFVRCCIVVLEVFMLKYEIEMLFE